MKNNFIKKLIYVLIFLPIGCGFKVVNNSSTNDFLINEITLSGDKRINFKIRNNLMVETNKDSKNILLINVDTKKIKTIKDKNIKNEITRYQLVLDINIDFNLVGEEQVYKNKISVIGDYSVADNYSTTLTNEKKLIENLTEDISKKILKNIRSKLNDI